jgi:Ala-tRNA(Pro) deacylase
VATRRIREYLDGNKVPYTVIIHTCAHTAEEVALASHIPARKMAKVVVVQIDDELAFVAVPANKVVDLARLRDETGAANVRLAEEDFLRTRFSDCQVGTVPPFGNLFGIETFIDRQLTVSSQIAFSAGTHRDVFVLRNADYNRIVHPRIVDVAAESEELAPTNTQDFEELPETEELTQAQCGCPILHHHWGAD